MGSRDPHFLTTTEAEDQYLPLAKALVQALEAAYPELNFSPVDGGNKILRESQDGGCIIRIENSASLVRVDVLAGGWESVAAAIARVFAAADSTLDEHWTGRTSEVEHGGRVQISVHNDLDTTKFLFIASVSYKDYKRDVRRYSAAFAGDFVIYCRVTSPRATVELYPASIGDQP